MERLRLLMISAILIGIVACSEESDLTPDLEVPSTYEFLREGESSVSFDGQTTRLDMLSEIKAYVQEGDKGNEVVAQQLLDMYANQNNAFDGAGLNTSGKDLESKTFLADVQYYKDLFIELEEDAADASANGTIAQSGVAGLIERGNSGNFILVNEKGWEYTQFIEKGLIGSVFFHQIMNVYLSDDKIGPNVDNETLVEGENYTAKEHHWDEAFGYWGVPVDFPLDLPAEARRFWATYTYGRDEYTGSVEKLKNAFLKGRTAIVNNNEELKNEAVEEVISELEIVSAATAVHYINSSIDDFNNADQGNLFHHVSEAYMFVRALKFSPIKKISTEDIEQILNSDLGENKDFWNVTIEGLNAAKQRLVESYPSLENIADEL